MPKIETLSDVGKISKEKRLSQQTELVAQALLTEVPVSQLARMLQYGGGTAAKGSFCGGGCDHPAGKFCGLACSVMPGAIDVFDPEGKIGLTSSEITMLRKQMPAIRQTVQQKILDVIKSI